MKWNEIGKKASIFAIVVMLVFTTTAMAKLPVTGDEYPLPTKDIRTQ